MHERWAWVEVDLDAIRQNVRALKALLPKGALFMAVVKADAYGHGATTVARVAAGAGADRFGVATLEEALELKDAGIEEPVQLLTEPPPETVPLLLEHDIVPTVTTRDFAVELGRVAVESDKRAPFHLKVDTGMNRIGVPAADAATFALALKDHPGLVQEGTFTHYATADVPGDWDFQAQVDLFEKVLAQMKVDGVDPGVVHSANSAATILAPRTHQGMVRCGIAVYGLHPSEATRGRVDLKPAMSVRAKVALVKRIGMGEGVSYGLEWRASSPTTVATIPLGYADGVHRVLSGKMDVLIGGVRCPQVGRVTMDQVMVEVPRGLDVSIGDDVVVVGSQKDETITMDEVADKAQTINYEMACAFGMRMERMPLSRGRKDFFSQV